MTSEQSNPDTTLRQQLDAFKQQFTAMVPPEVSSAIFESIRELARSGLARQSLKEGDKAPDFTLPNVKGEPISLSELLARGPVIVAFYRGVW
jgi:hypothetical protein